MNCERAHDLILLFLAGELATEEAEVLRPHLLGCPACTRFMAEQRRWLRRLDEVREVEESPGFAARTAATVARGSRARSRAAIRRLAAVPAAPWFSGLAAAALLFAALRFGPGTIPDLPYDLSFLEPAAEEPTLSEAEWVDLTLADLRDQIDAARPEGEKAEESVATTSEVRWNVAVGRIVRRTEILEWEVTAHGRTNWSRKVDDIEERLADLAVGLEDG